MDFVLWKPSSPDLPGWESPWGRGRPGWHIECSAMAYELLGESFDIHGGGNDLMFPHHENEIAQSCCAHPEGDFAKVWMHNEMLQVEGKKMSKSLGNFFTVRDLLEQGVPGEVIRFVFLSTHYRKPMDWTEIKAVEAEATIFGFIETISAFGFSQEVSVDEPSKEIVEALENDLNTHAALEHLRRLRDQGNGAQLASDLLFLGLFDTSALQRKLDEFESVKMLMLTLADRMQGLRNEAMKTKDFAEVDQMKAELSSANISVMMGKEKVELRPELNFDLAKLEALK